MKIKKLIFGLLFAFSAHAVYADDCIVLGYHEPGTQTYFGPTWCTGKSIKDIIVRGPLSTTHSILTGLTNISGPIDSRSTTFHSIKEKNLTSESISLKNISIVNGDIVFVGPPGTVYLDHSSSISGKVVNGKIISI